MPTLPSICGLRWCWYWTEKYLPDSHPPLVYVVILSISPIRSIGETNPSTKTSKILFSMVMPTFGKSCWRPWLQHIDQNVYHMDLLGPNKLITCISLPVFILVPCLAFSSHFRKWYSKQLTSIYAIMISGNGNTHLILNQLPLNFVR